MPKSLYGFFKKILIPAVLILSTAFMLCACSALVPSAKASADKSAAASTPAASTPAATATPTPAQTEPEKAVLTRTPGKGPKKSDKVSPKKTDSDDTESRKNEITEDGEYHDLETVVLYYDKYGKLPKNFITKKEAKSQGWEGGALDPYVKGASIGGDRFNNFENQLPGGKGVSYIECDIGTDGGKRGAKRLLISSDGRYFYTADHYETFNEVRIVNGQVYIVN